MTLRVATTLDIPELGRVRMSVRENRIPHLGVLKPGDAERMLGGDGCGWVCESDGRIVAFAIADLSGANVWALFVEPQYEGRGIGRLLHDTMMDWFFSAGVNLVRLSTEPNTRAQNFYQRAGWAEAGTTASGEIRFEMRRDRWLACRTEGRGARP